MNRFPDVRLWCARTAVNGRIRLFPKRFLRPRLIEISCRELRYYLTESPHSGAPLTGIPFFANRFIRGGDWDRNRACLRSDYARQSLKFSVSFRSVFQVFQDGIPYRECDEYRAKLIGATDYHRADAGELDRKYEGLKRLYDAMQREGYKSQAQLAPGLAASKPRKGCDEVRVAIDRDGNCLKVAESGNHRLALALLLDVDRIPVFIQGVHWLWVRGCCAAHGGNMWDAMEKEWTARYRSGRSAADVLEDLDGR